MLALQSAVDSTLPMTDFLEVPVEVAARDSSLRVGMTLLFGGLR
jgi:hypothetical protein